MTLDASTTNLTPSGLRSLIGSFSGKRVLVIGDMVADEYLIGRPARISREAPVLILELSEERTVPGGATNVAVNTRTLGAEVFLAGVVGDDLPGRRLRRAISDQYWRFTRDARRSAYQVFIGYHIAYNEYTFATKTADERAQARGGQAGSRSIKRHGSCALSKRPV